MNVQTITLPEGSGAQAKPDEDPKVASYAVEPARLFSGPDGGWVNAISIKAVAEGGESLQRAHNQGIAGRPAAWNKVLELRHGNPHHSSCLNVKCHALTGLGFLSDEVYKKLDPLTEYGIQDVIDDVTEDYAQTGNGFIEVVRDLAGNVKGLHHIPVDHVDVYLEDENNPSAFHFVVRSRLGERYRHFAKWGDRDRLFGWLTSENRTDTIVPLSDQDIPKRKDQVSEVIHFRHPTSMSRYWGLSTWLAAVPIIAMIQAEQQWIYDYFVNHGVADAIILFKNGEMNPGQWERARELLVDNVATGERRKTLLLHIPDPQLDLQVEKLATEIATSGQIEIDRNMAADLMSAHQVPPAVAAVALTAKIGNNREYKDQLGLFQGLTIAPDQNRVTRTLERTLGTVFDIPKVSREGQLKAGISPEIKEEKVSGWSLKRVTDEIDFQDSQSTIDAKQNGAMGGRPASDANGGSGGSGSAGSQ